MLKSRGYDTSTPVTDFFAAAERLPAAGEKPWPAEATLTLMQCIENICAQLSIEETTITEVINIALQKLNQPEITSLCTAQALPLRNAHIIIVEGLYMSIEVT